MKHLSIALIVATLMPAAPASAAARAVPVISAPSIFGTMIDVLAHLKAAREREWNLRYPRYAGKCDRFYRTATRRRLERFVNRHNAGNYAGARRVLRAHFG